MPNERNAQYPHGHDDRSPSASHTIEQRIVGFAGGLKDYDAKHLVSDAESLAKELRGDLKSAQIRKIYGTVKGLEMKFKNPQMFNTDGITMLRPKLAYAANKKPEVRPLQRVLDACIQKIKTPDDFKRFVNFFEAILAYHTERR